MKLLHIFIGNTKSPEFYQHYFEECSTENQRIWPEKEYLSAYLKEEVVEVNVTLENGIVGNGIGYPTHIDNADFRTALIVNECVYKEFEELIPGSSSYLKPGCFGENFFVNDPALHPSIVCLGDIFKIGSAKFQVSGPRMPCPKVDAFVGVKGITAIGRKTSYTGYFLRVLEEGNCKIGDKFELLQRPYPEISMFRVQESLWGDAEKQSRSRIFLETLANCDVLIPRHYRETASQRLERLVDE